MKLRWKILGGLALAAIIGGAYAYQNRVELILQYVATRGKPEVGPNIEIEWQQGPSITCSFSETSTDKAKIGR